MAKRQEDDALNSNEFDCPNCGAPVFHDLLSCPNCGQRMYPGDDEAVDDDQPNPAWRVRTLSFSAIGLGWVVSTGIAFVINLLVSRIWSPATLNLPGQVLLFASPPMGAMIGGWLAARLASRIETRKALILHGLGVAILSLASAILLETYWVDLSSSTARPMLWLSWAILLIAGPLGAFLEARKLPIITLADPFFAAIEPRVSQTAVKSRAERVRTQVINAGQNTPNLLADEDRLYLDLLARVQHDFKAADNLIAAERLRKQTASRLDIIQKAIQLWDSEHPSSLL